MTNGWILVQREGDGCIRTLRTPDMEDMSRPKRPPPMQANEPTTYCNICLLSL